jgi:S1-C subfamily serine protease
MNQHTGIADPRKNHIGALAILALDLNDQVRQMLPNIRSSSGVVVIGRAAGFNSVNSSLQAGDVIESLNHVPVASVEQLRSAVNQLKSGDAAVLRIEREGQFQFVAFEME